MTKEIHLHLKRGLSWLDATSIVVGCIIGTGIFLKTATMSQLLGSGGTVLFAWAVAGVLSLAGALTYAELGSRFPQAGGEYVYLREAYGRGPAFLYGWMRFWIASPGSIAAYSVGGAQFLSGYISLDLFPGGKSGFALLTVLIFSAVNCLTVHLAGRVQTFLTALKILLIGGLIYGLFFLNSNPSHLAEALHASRTGGNPETLTGSMLSLSFPSWGAFGMALISALWAYDGWNNLAMVGGEISHPQRNIPKAFGLGLLLVFLIYSLVNLAYFHALPWNDIITAHSEKYPNALPLATLAAMTFLGAASIKVLSFAMTVSAWGGMNGSIMSGARVPYAMAMDQLFISQMAKLSSKNHTPYVAILVQGIWAAILALIGKFDELTDLVVFASWIFYMACTGSVFIFRRRDKYNPDKAAKLSYLTLGYPWIPIIFIGSSFFLLINTLMQNFVMSLYGLGFMLLGLPFYWYQKRSSPHLSNPSHSP